MDPCVVRENDHLLKLAHKLGFDADDIWNDASNSDLRQLRSDPNILLAGDLLHVPPQSDAKAHPLTVGATNSFTSREAPQASISVKLVNDDDDQKYASRAYTITELPDLANLTSDGGGVLTFQVPVTRLWARTPTATREYATTGRSRTRRRRCLRGRTGTDMGGDANVATGQGVATIRPAQGRDVMIVPDQRPVPDDGTNRRIFYENNAFSQQWQAKDPTRRTVVTTPVGGGTADFAFAVEKACKAAFGHTVILFVGHAGIGGQPTGHGGDRSSPDLASMLNGFLGVPVRLPKAFVVTAEVDFTGPAAKRFQIWFSQNHDHPERDQPPNDDRNHPSFTEYPTSPVRDAP